MAWVHFLDRYWNIDWKNIIFNKLVRINYWFYWVIEFLNTDIVSVIHCIIGTSLAIAKSMPKSMQKHIHNLFFYFFIFGMVLATITMSKIWQLGVSKTCPVKNLTNTAFGIRIAYILLCFMLFLTKLLKNLTKLLRIGIKIAKQTMYFNLFMKGK